MSDALVVSPISSSSGNVANATAAATLAGTFVGGASAAAIAANPSLYNQAIRGRPAYLAGFALTADGATAAASVSATVTGVVGGPLTFTFGVPAGVGVPAAPLVVTFEPPIPEAVPGGGITVSLPALGAGNAHAAVSAWGFIR